jgi:hypothetical protein
MQIPYYGTVKTSGPIEVPRICETVANDSQGTG